MQILVIGNTSNLDELKQKVGPNHNYILSETEADISELIQVVELVFDFAPNKKLIKSRYSHFCKPVFFNTSLVTLSELIDELEPSKRDSFFGFCGLPTFVNRSVLEVSLSSGKSEARLKSICLQLQTDFVCVDDRVGLVTPRVICMVINEAYYALEESIATRDDIDLAMKLGTNYPFGPFEWAKKIGICNVIGLLEVVYLDTDDARYKVCELLRTDSID